MTVLKEGSSGDAVKKLQEDLQKLRVFKGGCSGYYDSLTAFSVKQFQLKYNIIGEGDVAGYKTLFTLRDLLTPVEITDKLKSLMELYEKVFVKARVTEMDILPRLDIFYNLVKTKGPVDLKNLPEWRHYQFIFENEVIDNDVPGNILYG
ncbi:peptidoglycan-binding domain-containing protein [Clostridium algidicarnis]|uniref:Peptidoglycan-binding protein n=1 Tax=Clostridium algidicarnis TaxID=37659 RepID=A0ABS6C5X1_9CLOT|nr:peptidoglycan-binding domain-containing protein [Clostridium algidicarnis]MBU3220889.1 peptidoglycan-binding protein [Clostridium algidicarnis]